MVMHKHFQKKHKFSQLHPYWQKTYLVSGNKAPRARAGRPAVVKVQVLLVVILAMVRDVLSDIPHGWCHRVSGGIVTVRWLPHYLHRAGIDGVVRLGGGAWWGVRGLEGLKVGVVTGALVGCCRGPSGGHGATPFVGWLVVVHLVVGGACVVLLKGSVTWKSKCDTLLS